MRVVSAADHRYQRLSVQSSNSAGSSFQPVLYMGAENIPVRSSVDAGSLGSPMFRPDTHSMPVPPVLHGSAHTDNGIHQLLYQSNAELQQTREQVTQLQEELNGVRQWMSTLNSRHLVPGAPTYNPRDRALDYHLQQSHSTTNYQPDPRHRAPDHHLQQSHSMSYQQSPQRVQDSQNSWPRIADSQQSLRYAGNSHLPSSVTNYRGPQPRPSNSQPSPLPSEYQQSRSWSQKDIPRDLRSVPSRIMQEAASRALPVDTGSRREQTETRHGQISAQATKRQLRDRTPVAERFVSGNAKQSQSSTVAQTKSPARNVAQSPFRERAQGGPLSQTEGTIASRARSPTAERDVKPRSQTSTTRTSLQLPTTPSLPSRQRDLKFDPVPHIPDRQVDSSYALSTRQQPPPKVDGSWDNQTEETIGQDRRRSPGEPRFPPSSNGADPRLMSDSTSSATDATAAPRGRLLHAPSEPQMRQMDSLSENPVSIMADPTSNPHSFASPTFHVPSLQTKPNIPVMETTMRNRAPLQVSPFAAPQPLHACVASGAVQRHMRARSVEVPDPKIVALYESKGIRAISPRGTRNATVSSTIRPEGASSPVPTRVQPEVATVPTPPLSPSAHVQKSPSIPLPSVSADVGSPQSATPRSGRNSPKTDALTRSALKKLVDTNDNINRLIRVLGQAVSIWQPTGRAGDTETRCVDDTVDGEVAVNFSCGTSATSSSEFSEAPAAKPQCASSSKRRHARTEHTTPLEPNDFTQNTATGRVNSNGPGETTRPSRKTPVRSRQVLGKVTPDKQNKTRSVETIVQRRSAASSALNATRIALDGDELNDAQVEHAVVKTPLVKAREGAHSVPRQASPVQPFARQLSPRQPFGPKAEPTRSLKQRHTRKPPVPAFIPNGKFITAGAPRSKLTQHTVRSLSPHERAKERRERDMPKARGAVATGARTRTPTRTNGASGITPACQEKGRIRWNAPLKKAKSLPRFNEDSTLSGSANTYPPAFPGLHSTDLPNTEGEVDISARSSLTSRASESASPPFVGRRVEFAPRRSPLNLTPRSPYSGSSWMPMQPLSDRTESVPLLMKTTIQFYKPTCIRCFEAKVFACDERCLVVMDRNTKRIFAANIPAKYVAVLAPTDVAYVTDIEGQLWSNEQHHAHFRRAALPDNCFASGVVYREKLFVADAISNCVWALNPTEGTCLLVISALNNPQGLNWFGEYLLIADTGHGRIVKVRNPLQRLPEDEVIIVGADDEDSDDQQPLSAPMDVAINPAGYMFIADAGNQCIMVWPPNASAGKLLKNYTATHPDFVQPRSVCISHHWLLVADYGYSDVLQIKLNSKARKR